MKIPIAIAIKTWMYRTEYHGRRVLVIASPSGKWNGSKFKNYRG